MQFSDLHRRLVAAMRERVSNGEVSERRLARLTGISQPHIHNVLKGERILSSRAADAVLQRLGITLMDLLDPIEADGVDSRASGGCAEVPVLEGWLGPGLPLPIEPSSLERYPFPRSFLASMQKPLVARLAEDARLAGFFRINDLVLLDSSPARRLNPGKNEYFVINRRGEGVVRRLSLERHGLLVLRGAPGAHSAPVEALLLEGSHLLDVVRARIAWIGRSLHAHAPLGPSAT